MSDPFVALSNKWIFLTSDGKERENCIQKNYLMTNTGAYAFFWDTSANLVTDFLCIARNSPNYTQYWKNKSERTIREWFYLFIYLKPAYLNYFPQSNVQQGRRSSGLHSEVLASINVPEPQTFPLGERHKNTAAAILTDEYGIRVKHIHVIHVWIWYLPDRLMCFRTWPFSGALVGEAVDSLGCGV